MRIICYILSFILLTLTTFCVGIPNKSKNLFEGLIVDLVLIYGGGAHRDVVWNKEHFSPYISYTNPANNEQWLFDGFLFLDIIDGKGKIFATGYNGSPASKDEWKSLIDYYFAPDQCIDALDNCIAEKIRTLDEPSKKRQIIIGLLEPIVAGPDSHYKNIPADYWGDIDGKKLDFNIQEDRITACKWYIDCVRNRFSDSKFNNLELAGFYWIAEESLHSKTILSTVGNYLDDAGFSFNWIPYWKENPDYLQWKDLGFHKAYLQPNYFFNEQIPYFRLDEACKIACEYDLDLELEFDLRVFANNGDRGYRLYDYMNAFRQNSVLTNKRIAYYQDCDAIYQLYRSTDEKAQAIFHDFCSFVLEHQSVYIGKKTEINK